MQFKFKVGDTVRKIKGYKFEGFVIGMSKKMDGERILVDVEAFSLPKLWCESCKGMRLYTYENGKQEVCFECKGKGFVESVGNCNGMVHIFAENDLELWKQ